MEKYEKLEQIVAKIMLRAELLRARPLAGGISATVIALEMLQADGRPKTVILRAHGEVDRQINPRIAADEFRLLRYLKTAGLPVPNAVFVDESNDILPMPYLIQEWIDGEAVFSPENLPDFLHQVSTTLTRIHQTADPAALDFLPRKAALSPVDLFAEASALGFVPAETAINAASISIQSNRDTLLHGDFWPGNLLWKDGHLAAVIDWEDAAVGDPLADIANMRLEILWALGIEAMQHFTKTIQGLHWLDFSGLPLWDIATVVRQAPNMPAWGLDAADEQSMREKMHWFVAQVLERVSR